MPASCQSKPKQVLFLCTGNYYRSRMAEELFNHYARQARLPYRAFSRGLAPDISIYGFMDTIAPYALAGLEKLGVKPRQASRPPACVEDKDIATAALIVALRRQEHEPVLAARYPQVCRGAIYWDVPDVDEMPALEAAEIIDRNVRELIEKLRSPQPNLAERTWSMNADSPTRL